MRDDILFDDAFFFGVVEDTKEYTADELTEEEWLESLEPEHEEYAEIFGYRPNYKDYHCTRTEYDFALWQALEEKKELSEYLQKRIDPNK